MYQSGNGEEGKLASIHSLLPFYDSVIRLREGTTMAPFPLCGKANNSCMLSPC